LKIVTEGTSVCVCVCVCVCVVVVVVVVLVAAAAVVVVVVVVAVVVVLYDVCHEMFIKVSNKSDYQSKRVTILHTDKCINVAL
jgi:hypothetical protein